MTDRRGPIAPRLLRVVGVGSTLYGAVLLTAPRAAVGVLGRRVAQPPSWIVRMLGARQIGQGAALLLRPTPATVIASAATDGLHAATMVAAALRWPRYRRVAVASGAVALVSGVLAAVSAG